MPPIPPTPRSHPQKPRPLSMAPPEGTVLFTASHIPCTLHKRRALPSPIVQTSAPRTHSIKSSNPVPSTTLSTVPCLSISALQSSALR
ncbi:hypothetical protein K505DRAFT_133366 [Melanomma pulvis-pyrius CBS 109.77]|uniref:Uncharacterized protein n=1 Tax=Melanomma pulvis-pyrius CBS 109.77 TaxID=1314802 RepID=A0A6A6WSL4_9PLEO|nr:hypothetical protein K505DRAFT_133366 [Melanomma pulvis-pyrius CBS 109.77]